MPPLEHHCTLNIRLLGPMQVCVAGQPVQGLHRRGASWLLGLLALRAGRDVSRSTLAELLWQEKPEDEEDGWAETGYNEAGALRSLTQTLGVLKKTLGAEADHLCISDTALRFEPGNACVDVLCFQNALKTGNWNAALDACAHGGTLLEAFPEQRTAGRQEMERRRRDFERDLNRALVTAAQEAVVTGEHAKAQQWAERAVQLQPTDQAASRTVMEAQAGRGAFVAVEGEYRRLGKALAKVGDILDEETEDCFQRLMRTAEQQAQAAQAAREATPDPFTPHNIPALPGALIGREADLTAVMQKIRTADGRLVTLWGPGGVGKTWLALKAADQLKARFLHGAWYVDLAPLQAADGAFLPSAVASALRLPDKSPEGVWEALQHSERLLVLNNCEHLRDACRQFVDDLRAQCSRLRILVTSQRPLQAANEMRWPVAPLLSPVSLAAGTFLSPDDLLRAFPAVQLFVQQAQLRVPLFRLEPDNAAAVAAICERLGGIPLALVMAAACVSAVDVQTLARMLAEDGRFDLLIGDTSTPQAQQQTLLAVMDWSYHLLPPDGGERILLNALSVFRGGWSLQAAEAVCGLSETATFPALRVLIDSALVSFNPAFNRYTMQETVRVYAGQKLAVMEASEKVFRRHLDWCLNLASRAEADRCRVATFPGRVSQSRWMDILEQEHGNLRAALDWSFKQKTDLSAVVDGLRLAVALALFWNVRSFWREGRNYLCHFLDKIERDSQIRASVPPETWAEALNFAGMLAIHMGDYEQARRQLMEGWRAACEIGPCQEADLLVNLGYLASKGVFPEIPAEAASAVTLDKYRQAMTESADAGRAELGSFWALYGSAWDLYNAGCFAQAQTPLRAGRQIAQKYGDDILEGHALQMLAKTARAQGQIAEAFSACRDGLLLCQKNKDFGSIAVALETLSDLALSQEDRRAAVLFLGTAWAARRSTGAIDDNLEQYLHAHLAGRLINGDADEIAAWWRCGAGRSREEIFAYDPQQDL